MAVRQLEMSHEWGSYALRDVDTGDRVDPADLPIPASIVDRLNAWSTRWDLAFDVDKPDHIKVDRWVLDELATDGAKLWRAVLTVLPPAHFAIGYRHDDTIYRSVDELPDEWRLA